MVDPAFGSSAKAHAAGRVIDRIDYDGREVHVNLTKDKIRQAPNYDAERKREEAYRQDDGTYYGP